MKQSIRRRRIFKRILRKQAHHIFENLKRGREVFWKAFDKQISSFNPDTYVPILPLRKAPEKLSDYNWHKVPGLKRYNNDLPQTP